MSTSTVFIKQPLNYRGSLALVKKKCKEYSGSFSVVLWICSGLYMAAHSNFNSAITGLTLSFCIHDLLLMSFSSIALYSGLHTRNTTLFFPWIVLTVYSLYFNHYQGLIDILSTLKRVKKLSWLPWSNLIVNIILLIIRGTLMIRIFQLFVHLWFNKKLNEMKMDRIKESNLEK